VSRPNAYKPVLDSGAHNLDSTTNQLRSQLSTLQSSFHKANAELSVSQTRLDVSVMFL
jgi:hypothetical protein